MKRLYSTELIAKDSGSNAYVQGWVHETRDLGGIRFILLRDRDGIVQITAPKKEIDQELFKKMKGIPKESVISIEGKIQHIKSAPNGVEIIPKSINIINKSKSPLPLDPTGKTPAELDTRLDSRFMDMRKEEIKALFKLKSAMLSYTREYFHKMDFIEINTPKIIASSTEGGTDLFPISYFEKEAFLAQSPQLYKEILTSSLENVFEIGPIFRAEEHDTNRHLNEVISIDIEKSFASSEDVMILLENTIAYIYEKIVENNKKELKILKRDIKVPRVPFERIKYSDAIDVLNSEGVDIKWGDDFSTSDLKILGNKFNEFYFLVDWPMEIKPFYIMHKEEDNQLSNSFDLMRGGLELSSGGQRVHLRDLLESNLKDKGLDPVSFEYHLKCFDFGMPPHSGWGLGAERLLMSIVDKPNIREVVIHPRDRFRLTP